MERRLVFGREAAAPPNGPAASEREEGKRKIAASTNTGFDAPLGSG